jgi:pyruvate dehydrogenase E1 component alpha subunit
MSKKRWRRYRYMNRQEAMKSLSREKLAAMLRRMLEIRVFEEKIRYLFLEGKMPGTVHQYIGMEACAVGVCSALQEGDVVASTHRPHGHAIARGVTMKSIMAELYGKTEGCCRGKGGSMHVGDLAAGMLPAIAIVGGNLPIVMGMGLAFKLRKDSRVAVSFFGDGASNEGAFHEALNMAAVYNVPAVFVCENNQYGASTSIKKMLKIENVAERARAYGMREDIADGMDVIDVFSHAGEAVEAARRGEGPTLLELKTFRLCGHSRRDPNNYMTEDEKEYWNKRDPIPAFEGELIEGSVLKADEIEHLKAEVENSVDEAIEFGQRSTDPDPEDLYDGLYTGMEVPR